MKRTPTRDFLAGFILAAVLSYGYLTGGWTSVGEGLAGLVVGFVVARAMRRA